jgi:polysaccharide biosynthesis protein PslA
MDGTAPGGRHGFRTSPLVRTVTGTAAGVGGVDRPTRLPGIFRRSMLRCESLVSGIVAIADTLTLAAAGLVSYALLSGWSGQSATTYATGIAAHVVLTLAVFKWAGLYDCDLILAWPARAWRMARLIALVTLSMLTPAVALRAFDASLQLWALGYFFLSAFAVVSVRGGAMLVIRRLACGGMLVRTVAIVGASDQAWHVVSCLRQQDTSLRRVVGVFDDRHTQIGRDVDGLPVLGSVADLIPYARTNKVHDVVVTLPWDERLVGIIGTLRTLPVHVYVYLGSDLIRGQVRHEVEALRGMPLIKIASAPLTGWDGILKSVVDKIAASVLLVLLLPLLLLISLAIRLDSPGPVLFKQKRYGFNNREIVVLKFRSMWDNRRGEADVPQACKDDGRVTPVGRVLRAASLDELPQLLNVLQGTMSMVGPRPHAVVHNELYARLIDGYDSRHNVKPGVTGWAQINGFRGETDTLEKMRARLEHDMYYIENWSLWLDIKILIRTAFVAWTQPNAY